MIKVRTIDKGIIILFILIKMIEYIVLIKLQELGFTDFTEGSLYPLLLRLEKKGLIKGVKKKSQIGPDRKYYSLTDDGIEEVISFKENWDKINNAIQRLWN